MKKGNRNIIGNTVSFGKSASLGNDNEIRGNVSLNIGITHGNFIATESVMVLNSDTIIIDMRNPHNIATKKLSEVINDEDLIIAHAAINSKGFEKDVILVFKNTEYKQNKLGYKVLENA